MENFTSVSLMIKRGANRIELNSDLTVEGITPSFGMIKKTVEFARRYKVPVIVMIRPRSGNFVYTADELEIMNSDIQVCSLLNTDGIAFDCLTNNKQLDKIAMKQPIATAHAGNIEVVMHMAFDELIASKQKEVLEWLSESKIVRILTHGGSLDRSVIDCFENLKELSRQAKDKIEILPGGSTTDENVNSAIETIGVTQAHGAKILGRT